METMNIKQVRIKKAKWLENEWLLKFTEKAETCFELKEAEH